MRRSLIGAVPLALALALSTAPLTAQGYVGAYATLPSGDFGEYAKTGWMAEAGYGIFRPNTQLTVWLGAGYGSNSHEGDSGDKTNLLLGLATVTYNLTASESSPYVIGGLGYLSHRYSPGNDAVDSQSEGGLLWTGGAGYGFGRFWLEGRYNSASIEGSTTSYLSVGVGVSF